MTSFFYTITKEDSSCGMKHRSIATKNDKVTIFQFEIVFCVFDIIKAHF